jgi:hypothetical protein
MGFWQRAMEHGHDLKAAERELRTLIAEFRGDPSPRPDAAAGLRWVAATLEHVIDHRKAVCTEWPEVDEPWFKNVQKIADDLGNFAIPPHLLTGTKNLFLNMILQNSGLYRRHAIETVVVSGWSRPIALALGDLLKAERDEAWLRVRAEFALGFLQRPNEYVERDLTDACKLAWENMRKETPGDDQAPPRARITEVHSSLFAVGDCFGVTGAEERAKSAQGKLVPILSELAADSGRAPFLRRATRAAAYLLTFTAQPRVKGQRDISEVLLSKLATHPDPVTANLSNWALRFRFASDGSIRPLLDTAEHEASFGAFFWP